MANNPKAMMAEGCALFHNLIFSKCLPQVSFLAHLPSLLSKQLGYLVHLLSLIKHRILNFQTHLIKEARRDALLHGLLSFFKHLFYINVNDSNFVGFKVDIKRSDPESEAWRAFFKDLLQTTMTIS